jgi:MFS family permease
VRLLAIAMVGQMWTFNTFSTFLPSFLETSRGLTRIQAGGLSSLIPLAGVAGALICGVATGMLGRRKLFLWPLMVASLAAALVIVNLPVGLPVYIAIALLGFTSAGLSPTLMTVVMELKGATAASTAAAFALIFGVSFFISFFVSPAFGALVPIWGIRLSMTAFSLPLFITIIALTLIPETGPKANLRSVQPVSA